MSERERVVFRAEINGDQVEILVRPHQTLLEVLRDELDLTGTKEGCGEGVCGACTVLVDGRPRRACLTLALEADGSRVLTVEGLAPGAELSPEQRAFVEHGAIQCGFCTPGMLIAARDLLRREAHPEEGTIRRQIAGHVCRCTGYAKIVEAIAAAARDKEADHA